MRLKAVILLLLVFFLPKNVHAQENWDITRYHADIQIEKSGEVLIGEDIAVNFGQLEKHGIYRDIPFEYRDSGGDTYYTEINVNNVLQDGSPAKYELIKDNGNLRIKIGDGNKTINGEHRYQIVYSVRGILLGYEGFDELYWNVIGSNWDVPISNASARVILPEDGIVQSDCFVGAAGSQESCLMENISPKEIDFVSPRVLFPYEGFSVAVGFTQGMVPLLTVEKPKTLFEKFIEWPSLFTLFAVAVSGVLVIFLIWYRNGRDFWYGSTSSGIGGRDVLKPLGAHETVVVEYEPPEKLRPAELGVLFDETAHTHDVTATIVDLATRGYLTITEIEKKWAFGKSDYKFVKKDKSTASLLDYEKLLLTHLFKTGKEVEMSDLKMTFYDELQQVKTKLYADMVKKGYFPKDPERIRGNYLIGAIVGVIGSVGLFITGINRDLVFVIDIGLGFLVAAVLLAIFSKFMPRRTAKGRELYRRIKGYRLFITKAETHRQRFFEKKNMFNEVLPYAMVFELTDKYIKALSGLEIQKQTSTWYHGSNAFTMAAFSSSMNSFSSSVGGAISSTPKSSGSSGGGSSGGGFGGGGGGSW